MEEYVEIAQEHNILYTDDVIISHAIVYISPLEHEKIIF